MNAPITHRILSDMLHDRLLLAADMVRIGNLEMCRRELDLALTHLRTLEFLAPSVPSVPPVSTGRIIIDIAPEPLGPSEAMKSEISNLKS